MGWLQNSYADEDIENQINSALRFEIRLREAQRRVHMQALEREQRALENKQRDNAYNDKLPAKEYAWSVHRTQDGRILFWKDMDTAHLMHTVRLHQRCDRPRKANAMWRYAAWREKAHA